NTTPQTDGASERKIRSCVQVMRSMVSPDQKDWTQHIPMTEFALNSSINRSTGFAPFELTYGYLPRILTGIQPRALDSPGVRSFAQQAIRTLAMAHDAIISARVISTTDANKRRKDEPYLRKGMYAYLSTADLSIPKDRARKLVPPWVGPYLVIGEHKETSTYTLNLPDELAQRQLHPTFHVSKLRPAEPNDEKLFPKRDLKFIYDFGAPDENELFVERIVTHRWMGNRVEFLVHWVNSEPSWEPYQQVRNLEKLDEYFALQNVKDWKHLPKTD
ncbi:unnamed protein product, partial [Peniophora sp. CBMAI 1063]